MNLLICKKISTDYLKSIKYRLIYSIVLPIMVSIIGVTVSLSAIAPACQAAQPYIPTGVSVFDGVSIAAQPDQKSLMITAVITNNGKDTVTLINGGAFIFNGLVMFDNAGNRLSYTNVQWQ